ncbi:hypothetical protein LJC61_03225 [Ruminococcaceae bacterium OttesenSCG-928-A16]|nr:hypothetical protein [Ruminococcaceae bacterium OttesenSCG-928-A16]
MKNKYSGLAFLAELLINVAVFSAACAILVGVFSDASLLAKKTTRESLAMAELYTLTEIIKAEGEDALPGAAVQADGSLLLTYTEDWRQSSQPAAYTITLQLTPTAQKGGTLTDIVAVANTQTGEEICRLQTAHYRQNE